MNRYLILTLLAGVMLLTAQRVSAEGQSELNPDITIIPDVRALAGDATDDDLAFEIEQVEIGAQAMLNPFARGEVFFRYREGELELQEAFATFTTLPSGLGLRAGKYRLGIGRFNGEHAHGFPFLDYPLLVREFFGERGFADLGLGPSILLDFGAFPVTLSTDMVAGKAPDETVARGLEDFAYNGRLSAFFTLVGEASFFEIGATGGTHMLDLASKLRAIWVGADGKFKWRPNRRTSVEVAGEFLAQRRKAAGGSSDTPAGAFGYINYQFLEKWNIGGLAEYVQLASNSNLNQKGFGGFAGYSLYGQTTLVRLLVRHDDLPADLGSETSVQLQLLLGLGKHKPQAF